MNDIHDSLFIGDSNQHVGNHIVVITKRTFISNIIDISNLIPANTGPPTRVPNTSY